MHVSRCAVYLQHRTRGPKPTILYSNYKFLPQLQLPLPDLEWEADMVSRPVVSQCMHCLSSVQQTNPVRKRDGDGPEKVTGSKDLKLSQHYPPMFGRSVAELFIGKKDQCMLQAACQCVSRFLKVTSMLYVVNDRTSLRNPCTKPCLSSHLIFFANVM